MRGGGLTEGLLGSSSGMGSLRTSAVASPRQQLTTQLAQHTAHVGEFDMSDFKLPCSQLGALLWSHLWYLSDIKL